MIILDTDHLTVLKYPNDSNHRMLLQHMDRSSDQDFVTTGITVEEQMRGWLAFIHKAREIYQQMPAYAMTHNGRLLSANLRDFQKIENLRVENWLTI